MVTSVFLRPMDGELDVAAIEAYLAAQPDVIRDPLGTAAWMVCGLEEAVEAYRDARVSDPSEFPCVALIHVAADSVNVFQEYADEDKLRSARKFVRWMLARYRCRVEDEYQRSWTAEAQASNAEVLYPAPMAGG